MKKNHILIALVVTGILFLALGTESNLLPTWLMASLTIAWPITLVTFVVILKRQRKVSPSYEQQNFGDDFRSDDTL